MQINNENFIKGEKNHSMFINKVFNFSHTENNLREVNPKKMCNFADIWRQSMFFMYFLK